MRAIAVAYLQGQVNHKQMRVKCLNALHLGCGFSFSSEQHCVEISCLVKLNISEVTTVSMSNFEYLLISAIIHYSYPEAEDWTDIDSYL